MSFNDLFPTVVCINLDRRLDRWQRMSRRFSDCSIGAVRRAPAIDGVGLDLPLEWEANAGAFGCLKSHVAVIQSAVEAKLDRLLVFEDDVEFASDFARRFAAAFAQVPDDWDLVYLGCIHRREPVRITDSVAQVTEALSTFAYAIRRSAFGPFLKANEAASVPIDVNLARLQRSLACYCLLPHLAWVEEGYSDVQCRSEDHWYIRESLVLGEGCATDLTHRLVAVIPRYEPAWRDAGPEVVEFFDAHLRATFPGARITIVDRPVPADDLSAGGGYRLFVGSPTFVRQRHLLAGLQMCRTHDRVSLFRETVQLDAADTGEVLAGRGARIDSGGYPRRPGDGSLDWTIDRQEDPPSTKQVGTDGSVFQAPCIGMRLALNQRRTNPRQEIPRRERPSSECSEESVFSQ